MKIRNVFLLLAVGLAAYFIFESIGKDNLEKRHINDEIMGETFIVFNLDNGEWLYNKNETNQVYPASTTKIMTALLALEKGSLDDKIVAGNEIEMGQVGESTAFLQQGHEYSLKQLLSALMLPSGNDAARTIAIHIAKEEPGNKGLTNEEAIVYFTDLMNDKAQKLGANSTHFANPSGLHDDNHYTTAADMALIVQAAMKNETFKEIVNQEQYSDQNVTFNNTNLLLQRNSSYYYEGANGIKTGFTNEAGRCLVSSAVKNGQTIIAIVFGSTEEDIWRDSSILLDYGFMAQLEKEEAGTKLASDNEEK